VRRRVIELLDVENNRLSIPTDANHPRQKITVPPGKQKGAVWRSCTVLG
jgi:hypothetical protein